MSGRLRDEDSRLQSNHVGEGQGAGDVEVLQRVVESDLVGHHRFLLGLTELGKHVILDSNPKRNN